MFRYAVEVLHLSEAEAGLRIAAARASRKHPVLLEMLGDGRLHPARIETLKNAGLRFRNQLEAGPGGRQVQVEDPDGNPIELFEPAR